MGYFFHTFYFEPGSRMTGVWQARSEWDPGDHLVATASLVRLGRDQHDVLESDFLGSHMPFHFGGFHGMGPDGHPWAMMLQVAPASAGELLDGGLFWPMTDGLDRALHYNWEAAVIQDRGLTRESLVAVYRHQGVDASAIADWDVPDLLMGLLAECCYVPLPQIVAGRITQCAFPDMEHECQHDVFGDVFSGWMAGQLTPEESEYEPDDPLNTRHAEYWWPKKWLRTMPTKELRLLALAGYWSESEINGKKRKKLIRLLSTPNWKNKGDGANVIVT